jgi:phosphatidyl-myo-inositol dimannoside synthase
MAATLSAVWYVTRKFPPGTGGMQRLSFHVADQLRQRCDLALVRMGHGNWLLPFFIPWAATRLMYALLTRRVGVLLLGDPMLSVLGLLAKRFGVPVAVVVHGLDITYPNAAYQRYLDATFWTRFDAYICISRHVQALMRARDASEESCHLIHPGVDLPAALPGPRGGGDGEVRLLLLGRLVRRKGALWLVQHVLPGLVAKFPGLKLEIVGDGPDREQLASAIATHRLERNVRLHGGVDEPAKAALLASAHLVLLPNLPVTGDPEGFGLVALEAAAAGCYVLGSDLEGLRDSIQAPDTGLLLPAGDAEAWIGAIARTCADLPDLVRKGRHARDSINETHSWQRMGERYARVLDGLA